MADPFTTHVLPFSPDQKLTFVVGDEYECISEEGKHKVAGLVHILKRGFTKRFNISVSASTFFLS